MTKAPDTLEDLPLFTRYRADDPDTSREAAESVADKINRIQGEVLAVLETAGPEGLADFELTEILSAHEGSTYRTRRSELAARGLVVDSGRRVTRNHDGKGRRHIVWVLAKFQEKTDEARA